MTPEPLSRWSTEPIDRRRALARLGLAAGVGAGAIVVGGGRAVAAARAVGIDPQETAGPFPADGSNGPDLVEASLVRRDIRADTDGANVQDGIPLRLRLRVWDVAADAARAGVFVYVWHCNADGEYSGYEGSMSGNNPDNSWLRGVQETDERGIVNFRTIIPGRYQGRAAHIHLAVFPDDTFDPAAVLSTTQLAFNDTRIDAIYASDDRYATSLANDTNNAADNIFSDGFEDQLLRLRRRGRTQRYIGRSVIGI